MSIARVTEISATSQKGFEDAVVNGLQRANETLRHVKGAWIKEQIVECDEGKITGYRVNMMVTFVLDD
ncbi:dodecin domain-containing protein [Paracoccus caeni]|uniref:Dodecin domain-containing protein n=1 Tax=Paracoccus caeni TaxID=657651 RepID=A0A934SG66_9RHOB|nr:dodecin family protein [Paracoccus caeni]MBK4217272.1 dodecin domain-containing protein [Paracoccus caeni]